LLALMPSVAKAVCTDKDFDKGWLTNYEGTIGPQNRVRLTLTQTKSELTGVYFYVSQLKDIRIEGRVADGHITLDEVDPTGKTTAQFEGQFQDHDPNGKLKGELGCEIIVGIWHRLNSTETLPVFLSETSATTGTLDHRYRDAGAEDDKVVHRAVLRFWKAVTEDNKATVASLINYPIRVRIAGTLKRIRNRQELILQYDSIFSGAYRKAIIDAVPRNMFNRDQGIMLGNGEVWFGPDGRVITLNNN